MNTANRAFSNQLSENKLSAVSDICSATLQGRAATNPREAKASHYISRCPVSVQHSAVSDQHAAVSDICSATLQGRAATNPREAKASHYISERAGGRHPGLLILHLYS